MLLDDLPNDLLVEIISLLDPISLISLSQASQYLRSIIDPQRFHFVQRLLALETTRQYGGEDLVYKSHRRGTQLPKTAFAGDCRLLAGVDWEEEPFRSMRWACTHCMRLRSHIHFSTPALLRLAYRKPRSGSPADISRTSWAPNACGRQAQAVSGRRGKSELERKQYHAYLTGEASLPGCRNWKYKADGPQMVMQAFRDAGIEGFEERSVEEFSDHIWRVFTLDKILSDKAESVEEVRCGFNRHLRKCNECHFITGDYKRAKMMDNRGTAEFPILQKSFGIKDPSGNPFAPYGLAEGWLKYWITWMARCPGCTSWREIREFRIGGWNRWAPRIGLPSSSLSRIKGDEENGDASELADDETQGTYENPQGEVGFASWEKFSFTSEELSNLRCNSCMVASLGRETFSKLFHTEIIEPMVARKTHIYSIGELRKLREDLAEPNL